LPRFGVRARTLGGSGARARGIRRALRAPTFRECGRLYLGGRQAAMTFLRVCVSDICKEERSYDWSSGRQARSRAWIESLRTCPLGAEAAWDTEQGCESGTKVSKASAQTFSGWGLVLCDEELDRRRKPRREAQTPKALETGAPTARGAAFCPHTINVSKLKSYLTLIGK
jgi:hypothetical protein